MVCTIQDRLHENDISGPGEKGDSNHRHDQTSKSNQIHLSLLDIYKIKTNMRLKRIRNSIVSTCKNM